MAGPEGLLVGLKGWEIMKMEAKSSRCRMFFNITGPRRVVNAILCLLVCVANATGKNASQSDEVAENAGDPAAPVVHVEAHANRLLREMGDYLKDADAFTFQAESSYDVTDRHDQKIRYGGITDVSLRRPDRLHAVFNGDERQRQSFFDGKTYTIYNVATHMYAITDVPPDIDKALDTIFETYGFSVPLADLVYADPYKILIENVIEGRWVGVHSIAGAPCNHLAFIQESIDWQIWIEKGPRPVPRQVLITYKDEPGSPQYLARMKSWDFEPKFRDGYFQFTPPAGSYEIEFLPTSETDVNDD
jgi:hypothetical protein